MLHIGKCDEPMDDYYAVCYVVHVYSLCIIYTSTMYFVARRNEILLSNLIVTVQHGDVPEPQNHDCFFLSIYTPL